MISEKTKKVFEEIFGTKLNPIDYDWYATLNPVSSKLKKNIKIIDLNPKKHTLSVK